MDQEQKWRQEEDARVLAEAEAIKQDKGRLHGAQQAARRLLSEQEQRISGLKKVAGKKPAKRAQKPYEPFTLPRHTRK